MKSAFIVHGAEGCPEENWFSWLKKELEKLDYAVFIPKFPTPNNQTFVEWSKIFDKFKDKLNEEPILIGQVWVWLLF